MEMELGKRIREARLALGLSQRQLCGDEITRNMLSQIENGAARPSMDTLRYLAGRLGKSVSHFLEEETVTSPNQALMADARAAYQAARWQQVLSALDGYRGKDPLFDEEAALLKYLTLTALAEDALNDGRDIYAADLLEQAGETTSIYITAQTEHRRLGLLARATGKAEYLPSIDTELILRARLEPDAARCAVLLDAARDHSGPEWNYLRGRAHAAAGEYEAAVQCLKLAEEVYPTETAPLLERCYREMEDYKMAYFYACKQR